MKQIIIKTPTFHGIKLEHLIGGMLKEVFDEVKSRVTTDMMSLSHEEHSAGMCLCVEATITACEPGECSDVEYVPGTKPNGQR